MAGVGCWSLPLREGVKKIVSQDQVNNANSAFIFMINLLIIQGCQSGSVGRGDQLVRLSGWSGGPGVSGQNKIVDFGGPK